MRCTVLPHITASLFINDDESRLYHDYEVWLERLAPYTNRSAIAGPRAGPPRGRLHNHTGLGTRVDRPK
jgi:hypothetical protein